MERWTRQHRHAGTLPPSDTPLVLAREGTHGPVIHAVSHAARKGGVQHGARVVDARAICPALIVEQADLAGDAAYLDRLALWCRRWCPWSAADGPDGIVLDITGSAHLWGGEAAMLTTIEAAFARLGHQPRLAIAPTHGAAWALAHYGGGRRMICEPEHVSAVLARLPVGALRLNTDETVLLRRLGLKTIGALEGVPRVALARRFAKNRRMLETPLMRLDQAFGIQPEPVLSPAPPHRFRSVVSLPDPIPDPTPHLPELADTLCADMAAQGFGARRLRLEAFRSDGDVSIVEAATARPTRAPAHILRLFQTRLETLNPGFGFDVLALEATVAEPLAAAQVRLDGDEEADVALACLMDRLASRLGSDAVLRPRPIQSHVPERAERWVPALNNTGGTDHSLLRHERPIKLLPVPEQVRVIYAVPEGPPAQFVWRRLTHRVVRYEGPERIAPEWWRSRAGTRLRDYYRVEDDSGRRYWLFREGVLHDGRGGEPNWFVHGLFA